MSFHSYRLKAKEGVAEGLRRVALGRAEKALERLSEADDENLSAAIHGARKDLKKLRGLLRLVRDELGKKTFKAENRRYRIAGRLLSSSRDAEVKLETLTALRDRFGALPDETAEHWAGTLETERDELVAAVRGETEAQIGRARKAIEEGRGEIHEWSPRPDSWAPVWPGLEKSYRDGRRAMGRAMADPSAENVHAWRKRAKDLWYQLRIVRDAWPELLGTTIDQAHQLSDYLGDHHDLAVLAADLAIRTDLGERAAFEAAIEKRQQELLEAALGIGRRLYAEKPKAFRHRMKRYWLAWRAA